MSKVADNAPGAHWRQVAWCGLQLTVPPTFRPSKITGGRRRGRMNLADDDGPRLAVLWAKVTRPWFNQQEMVRAQLLRGVSRRLSKRLVTQIATVDSKHFQLMQVLSDEKAVATRCVGYDPRTRRLVELLYRHGSTRQDALVRQITFPSICNQVPGDAQRWAYFDVSFEAPAGYRYVRSALNVGDMRIWLANRGWRPGQIMLRQVYPAQLALQRFRLELWMEQMVYDQRREYQIARLRRGAAADYDKLRTPHGDGLMCEVTLRRPLRLIRWRTPRVQRNYVIHDQVHDRLVIFQVADQTDGIEPTSKVLIDKLHWAGMSTGDDIVR